MRRTFFSHFQLIPDWFLMVSRETMRADFFAGMTNAVIVLPQAVAFALIAGLPPEFGLYTAIVTPIVAAIFGSSRHAVSGPTTPVSLAIFAIISQFSEPGSLNYIEMVLLLTFMVGVIQLGFGLGRMGVLVNFISPTVVVGFTAGAAILIVFTQLKNISGLQIPAAASVLETVKMVFRDFWEIKIPTFFVAIYTMAAALIFKKNWSRGPYLLIAMIIGSGFALFLGGKTVDIRFLGELPSAIPPFRPVHFEVENMRKLLSSALAISILGLVQALAIAKGIGEQSGQRIDINRQFVGEGLSNLVGSFFSSYVGTGSFTRSGINFQSGARTPMSAIFAALMLLVILLLVRPWVSFLALPAMGSVILLVAWNLIDFTKIRQLFKASRLESTVFGVTFASTLLLNLETAILFGALSSLAYFLYKISHPHIATMAPDPERDFRFTYILRKPHLTECPQAKVIRIDGPLFYGSVDHIDEFFENIRAEPLPKNCLVFAEGIHFIGLAGAEWLVREAKKWENRGGGLYFVNLKIIAQDVLERGGYKESIGDDHFFDSKSDALAWLHRQADRSICAVCRGKFGGKSGEWVAKTSDATG
jgi:sulfate permease, SulP family